MRLPRSSLPVLHHVLFLWALVVDVGVLRPQLHRVQDLLHPLQLDPVHLEVLLCHALAEPVLLGDHLSLTESDLVDLLDMVVKVGGGVTGVVTQRTYKWFLAAVDGDVVLECLRLVGLVIAVSAVKFKYPGVRILTVQHLVKPHIAVPALVTSNKNLHCFSFYFPIEKCLT